MAEDQRSIPMMQHEIKLLAVDNVDLLKFCRLLAFIDSPVVPKILFGRACRNRVIWTESGELGSVPPSLSKVPSWLIQLFATTSTSQDSPLLQQAVERGLLSINRDDLLTYICLEDKWRNALRVGLPQATSLEYLFDVVAVVIHSFPETHAELLWEEIEEQLWDVISSTVLPLFAVSRATDILEHVQAEDTSGQTVYLQVLLTFLSRISAILGNYCPPSVLKLHEELFEHFVRASWGAKPVPRDELTRFLFFAPAGVQRANLLHQRSNERFNAAQAFNRDHSTNVYYGGIPNMLPLDENSWAPLSSGKPSTMEVLAMAILDGVPSVQKVFGIFLHCLPSQIITLLGFFATKQQYFETARDMLESSIRHIGERFGMISMEYLITGIELVKCYNILMEEGEGEKLARKLWSEVFGLAGEKINFSSLHQIYLATVLSDSLIGQKRYDEAEEVLLSILNYPQISGDMIVSTSLRLLKMSRRQRKDSPGFDSWKLLEQAVNYIEDVSDELKFEYVEEAMCHISVLDEDSAQLPRAEVVMATLSGISLEHYSGSETSKQHLIGHMQALQQYKKGFKIFSVTGPQLHFSRLIRDGFPHASISLIERIGTANWNRFNRVKELPLRANIASKDSCDTDGKTIAGKSEATFADSALGSSLQTPSRTARSQISYQSVGSAMGGNLENFPSMPIQPANGKPFECPICCKKLRGIFSAAQWEHHVYADLQPYICIVDRCSANMTAFGSRLEFTNHMAEHQDVVVWNCSACGELQDDSAANQEHISKAHPDFNIELKATSTTARRNMAEEHCPFCGVLPGSKFIGHICRHLEEVALTILPKEVGWDSNSDGEDTTEKDHNPIKQPVTYPSSEGGSFEPGQPAPPPAKKKIEWPVPVRLYVQRSFQIDNLLDDVSRLEMEKQLRITIGDAVISNSLESMDWDYLPLPQQMIQQARIPYSIS